MMIGISESQKGQEEPDKAELQELGDTTLDSPTSKGKYPTFQTTRQSTKQLLILDSPTLRRASLVRVVFPILLKFLVGC